LMSIDQKDIILLTMESMNIGLKITLSILALMSIT
jgi:hypothetical protein